MSPFLVFVSFLNNRETWVWADDVCGELECNGKGCLCVLWHQAVEGRLLRIEERLDNVEGLAAKLNHAEGKNTSQANFKHEMETLHARLLLLENRMVMSESRVSTDFSLCQCLIVCMRVCACLLFGLLQWFCLIEFLFYFLL